MATNYDINYDDERFTQVEAEKQQALTEVENTYGDMISQSDKYYQDQINASKEWADKQQQLQQDNTDFAIEQIEQQKTQANKDYQKEQSGAYTDWQKQSNAYGVNAEQMASSGLSNTGFSESSQVSMYNTYQNRVAVARESYNQAVLNYNNAIKDAQLQNNSALAEIAYTSLQQQLELSLQGFQYKNSLVAEQLAQKQATDDRYYSRYQDVLSQMNQENALAEEVRQYNENLQLQKKEFEESIRQFDLEMDRLKAQDKVENDYKIAQLELQKKQLEQEQAQWEKEYDLAMAKFEAEQLSVSSSISRSSGSTGGSSSSISKSYEVSTEYYQGPKNSDASKYGTFSNGYQPKGISGYGEVSKTGETIQITTQTLSGQRKTLVQNVWKTSDGTLWYWEGRKNAYVKISSGSKSGGGGASGGKTFKVSLSS